MSMIWLIKGDTRVETMAHVITLRHYTLQDACMGVFRVSKKPQLHAAAETTKKLGPLDSTF